MMLEEARKLVAFDPKVLSLLLWDGKERWDRFQAFQRLVEEDDILRNDPRQLGLGREEIYDLYCRKAKRVLEKAHLQDIKDFATQIFPEAVTHQYIFFSQCHH